MNEYIEEMNNVIMLIVYTVYNDRVIDKTAFKLYIKQMIVVIDKYANCNITDLDKMTDFLSNGLLTLRKNDIMNLIDAIKCDFYNYIYNGIYIDDGKIRQIIIEIVANYMLEQTNNILEVKH